MVKMYSRTCKYCRGQHNTKYKYAKVCDECKKDNHYKKRKANLSNGKKVLIC